MADDIGSMTLGEIRELQRAREEDREQAGPIATRLGKLKKMSRAFDVRVGEAWEDMSLNAGPAQIETATERLQRLAQRLQEMLDLIEKEN